MRCGAFIQIKNERYFVVVVLFRLDTIKTLMNPRHFGNGFHNSSFLLSFRISAGTFSHRFTESTLFHPDVLTSHEPKFGRAGSPLHAVVAMPNAEGTMTTSIRVSLSPQRGEVSPNQSSPVEPLNQVGRWRRATSEMRPSIPARRPLLSMRRGAGVRSEVTSVIERQFEVHRKFPAPFGRAHLP